MMQPLPGRYRYVRAGRPLLAAGCAVAVAVRASAVPVDPIVLEAQKQRIEMIERVAPAVVAVFDSEERGGGSGVLVDPEGYGLTNYHVLAGMRGSGRGLGGLNDGELYTLEVLGIDPTGDVAMFRLLSARAFPYVPLGDSEKVEVGDTVIAMGNPFVLSEDYTPAATLGIVSGVHRYQWGVKGNLTYSDCIQVDAPINPGNSGGPLFNEAGEVIGINGRISVDTRGRFNVGLAYAITTHQIRRFMPALRAGLLARHGSLQTTVRDHAGEGVVVAEVQRGGAADRAGIQRGDVLLAIDHVRLTSANHYVSLLGTYPGDWHTRLLYERNGTQHERIARLDPIDPQLSHPHEVDRAINLREVKRVLRSFQSLVLQGEPPPRSADWSVIRDYHPTVDAPDRAPDHFDTHCARGEPIQMQQCHEDGANGRLIEFDAEAARQQPATVPETYEMDPQSSMILTAMYVMYQWMLVPVDELDLTDVSHAGGDALIYPADLDDAVPRTDGPSEAAPIAELIEWPVAGGAVGRFAFDQQSGRLARFTVHAPSTGDTLTVVVSDYQDIGGIRWPCTMYVRAQGRQYRDTLSEWTLQP